MTTSAAIDRLVHHSIILELNIPSYRMEQAQKDRTVVQLNRLLEELPSERAAAGTLVVAGWASASLLRGYATSQPATTEPEKERKKF